MIMYVNTTNRNSILLYFVALISILELFSELLLEHITQQPIRIEHTWLLNF